MRKQTTSIDGFVPRRGGGSVLTGAGTAANAGTMRQPIARPQAPLAEDGPKPVGLTRQEVDESLKGISDDIPEQSKKRGIFRRRSKKVLTRKQKIIRRVIIAFVIIGVLIGAFIAFRLFLASNNVLQGNVFDIFKNEPLKMDANGRSNVLVFGTSEDDPGHEGANLTDSIMILSIDQNKKNAFMISIPRDLYVDYGAACTAGYQGKINALYDCHSNGGKEEKAGAKALQKKVSEVTGIDLQYYSHVNYTVVRDVVGALGGIEVTIESRDPRGVMDSNFDWKCKGGDRYASQATMIKNCPPSGHYIDFPNGKVKLSAEKALYLAMARGSQPPTYGFEQSNFDREQNQQKIVKAIREKAVSAGTLTDVGKVTGLIDALGGNLRTDFATSEVRTLMQLGQDIPSDRIKSISLVDEDMDTQLLTLSNLAGSVVVPTAGTFEYGQIQAFLNKKLSSNPVVREEANIVVLNGTQTPGLAQSESDKLSAAGYTITSTGNAPSTDYAKTTIYRLDSEGTSETAKALKKRYGTTLRTNDPGITTAEGTDFIIIVGSSARGASSGNN